MIKISLILLAVWCRFGVVSAVPMEGGTPLTNPALYSHLVHVRKGPKGSPGEFKCLGVVLSSVMIFTSNYCELTQHNSKDYHIDASFSNSDPIASSAAIANVYTGKHMNDFKQVTLMLPGLQMALPGSGSNGTSGIRAALFNNDVLADLSNMTLVALAFDGQAFKAGAVMIVRNKTECTTLYGMAVKQNHHMPVNFTGNLMCAKKAAGKTKYMMSDAVMDIEPGMPCDDSLGSPVMKNHLTVGMIIKAFCDPALMVAFVQPVIPPDTGVKPDVPDLPDNFSEGTVEIYTGTFIPVTGLSKRKPRMSRTPPRVVHPHAAKKLANKVVNELAIWCFVVALGIISGV